MIEYKGYIGGIEFDPDTNLLHGDVIGTRDVIRPLDAWITERLQREALAEA